jgi:hypothetical protein
MNPTQRLCYIQKAHGTGLQNCYWTATNKEVSRNIQQANSFEADVHKSWEKRKLKLKQIPRYRKELVGGEEEEEEVAICILIQSSYLSQKPQTVSDICVTYYYSKYKQVTDYFMR